MNALSRLFGGSPAATLAKLLFLSLVIGAIMSGFGLTPGLLLDRMISALRSLSQLGFGAVRDVGRYVLTGAVIVVPIWLAVRILQRGK